MNELAQFFGSGIALATVMIAVYQYTKAQKWKRSEFAARLLEKLSQDPALLLCCKALDWKSKPLPIPPKYRLDENDGTFQHDVEILTSAMRPHTEVSTFCREEVLYRDLFDEFFAFLEEVDHYISRGLISVKDVSPLEYWLEAIAHPRFSQEPIFLDYLQEYEFNRVFDLMEKFDINFDALRKENLNG